MTEFIDNGPGLEPTRSILKCDRCSTLYGAEENECPYCAQMKAVRQCKYCGEVHEDDCKYKPLSEALDKLDATMQELNNSRHGLVPKLLRDQIWNDAIETAAKELENYEYIEGAADRIRDLKRSVGT